MSADSDCVCGQRQVFPLDQFAVGITEGDRGIGLLGQGKRGDEQGNAPQSPLNKGLDANLEIVLRFNRDLAKHDGLRDDADNNPGKPDQNRSDCRGCVALLPEQRPDQRPKHAVEENGEREDHHPVQTVYGEAEEDAEDADHQYQQGWVSLRT